MLSAFCEASAGGLQLRISNPGFQPLRTMARAGIKPILGVYDLLPGRQDGRR